MRLTKASLALVLSALVATTTVASAQSYDCHEVTDVPSNIFKFGIEAPNFNAVSSSAARASLKRLWKNYRVAVKYFEAAQRERSRTKTARYYKRAATNFDSSLERAEKLEKRHAKDAAVVAEAMRLIPHLSTAVQVTYLELANAYISRGSYRKALDAVDLVVRLNSRNREALQLRQHIQLVEAVSVRS